MEGVYEFFKGWGGELWTIIKAKSKLYTPNVISFLYLEKLDSSSPPPYKKNYAPSLNFSLSPLFQTFFCFLSP